MFSFSVGVGLYLPASGVPLTSSVIPSARLSRPFLPSVFCRTTALWCTPDDLQLSSAAAADISRRGGGDPVTFFQDLPSPSTRKAARCGGVGRRRCISAGWTGSPWRDAGVFFSPPPSDYWRRWGPGKNFTPALPRRGVYTLARHLPAGGSRSLCPSAGGAMCERLRGMTISAGRNLRKKM